MGALLKLFGGAGGGWIVYAVIAVAVFGAGSAAGYKARGLFDAPIIAQLKADVAASKLDAANARTALSEQQKATLADVAKASELALATQTALQGQVDELTSKLAQADKARRDASTRLLDTLKAIPHEQQNTLSAGVRAYLLGVRDAQSAGTRATPAADSHEDGVPMASRAASPP